MRHIPRLARRCRRTVLKVASAGLAAALLLAASPGTASAASGAVKPILDCYVLGDDGVYTLVFGYTNTGPATSIPHGSFNSIVPAASQGKQPTSFATGTKHGVFSVRVPQSEVNGGYWYLDYNSYIFYYGVSAPSGSCPTDTQMPADGNGTGVVGALAVAAGFGALVVHRTRRRVAGPTVPESLDA